MDICLQEGVFEMGNVEKSLKEIGHTKTLDQLVLKQVFFN